MKRLKQTCNEAKHQELWIKANKTPDEVEVCKDHLTDVMQCHSRHGGNNSSRDMLIHEGRTKVTVHRLFLMGFLVDHGFVCGHGTGPRRRQMFPGAWKTEHYGAL